MSAEDGFFHSETWRHAAVQFSAATNLTVQVYAQDGSAVGDPSPATALFELLASGRARPVLFEDCARRVLAQPPDVREVSIHEHEAVATVSVPLHDGGVVVAGPAFVLHADEHGAQRLARRYALPFPAVWKAVRHEAPVSRQRLTLCGRLLWTLAQALLRDAVRARQLEDTSAHLADALRLKDEFLAVLSHELRTPLTPILGWTQVLRHRPDAGRLSEALGVIERNVRHQIDLVDELLDLNRIQQDKIALDLRPVDVREVVRAAVDSIAAAAAAKHLRLERSEPDHAVPVEADARRLGQVFANLLSNAVKFTPAGGRISVRVGVTEGRASIDVRDTGTGIAPEFLPFAFDMFRQQEQGIRRQHGGLGVGLALARRLTELHHGTIRAASAGVGHGAEMTVTLPLLRGAEALESTTAVQERLTLLPRFEGLRVLLVEDSEDTSTTTRQMLEHLGARVVQAADGRTAVHRARRETLDLVLCDLRMPLMDGFEFLRQIRGDPGGRPLPVIACSGLAATEDVRRAQEAGFDGYLRKPFDYDALADVLASVAPR